jgi:hypothetical protein
MAASFLISDCLKLIFSNLLVKYPINYDNNYIYISTKDIHSCTLVSKHWCETSTPFLYAYPFHHLVYLNLQWNECPFHYLSNSNSQWNECPSYYKLIRTLLSCIPKPEIEQIEQIEQIRTSNSSIIQNLLSYIYYFLNKTPSSTRSTFNYITFIRGIIFDKVLLNINLNKITSNQNLWLPPHIINDFEDHQLSKISIPIMKYFVEYLCKHCDYLIMLDFPFALSNDNLSDNIIQLLTSDDNNKLIYLKKLTCIANEDISKEKGKLPKDLYSSLSESTCNLNLLFNERVGSVREAISLSRFISSQNNLRHIILSDNGKHTTGNYNVVFESLSTQSESLQKLELKYLVLNNINTEALNSLCSLRNIKELNLYKCADINDNLNSWAESLTELEILECHDYYVSPGTENLLIQLIKSSSNTLTKLVLNYYEVEVDHLTQVIPLRLHSLIHLKLPRVSLNTIISILQSCTRLIYLGAVLSDEWDYIFRSLGRHIPENLQKIQFENMYHDSFSSTELRSFLEECKNYDSKLKYIEIVNCDDINVECLKVAEEFGIVLRGTRSAWPG